MLKVALVALLAVASVSGKKEEFPKFDIFHNHCQVNVNYIGRKCEDTYTRMYHIIEGFGGIDPGKGHYTLKENENNDYFWAIRTSRVLKTDSDVLITFNQTETGCAVEGRSRSKLLGFYDFEVNYCNVWNVFKYTDVFSDITTTSCKWVPTDPDDTCVKY